MTTEIPVVRSPFVSNKLGSPVSKPYNSLELRLRVKAYTMRLRQRITKILVTKFTKATLIKITKITVTKFTKVKLTKMIEVTFTKLNDETLT